MALDVLDLDDGVVDENAGDERDREKADEIEREAHQVHRPEGGDGRQRQGDRGDGRGAPVAQEQKHHDDGQERALVEGLHRGFVIAEGGGDAVVDLGEGDVRVGRGELGDRLGRAVGDRRVGGALGAVDREGDDRLAVEPGEGARLLPIVDDLAEFGEAQLPPARS